MLRMRIESSVNSYEYEYTSCSCPALESALFMALMIAEQEGYEGAGIDWPTGWRTDHTMISAYVSDSNANQQRKQHLSGWFGFVRLWKYIQMSPYEYSWVSSYPWKLFLPSARIILRTWFGICITHRVIAFMGILSHWLAHYLSQYLAIQERVNYFVTAAESTVNHARSHWPQVCGLATTVSPHPQWSNNSSKYVTCEV